MDQLIFQVNDLRAENSLLRIKRVTVLESNTKRSSTDCNNDLVPQLMLESSEREKSSYNAVIHWISESSSTLSTIRIADDYLMTSLSLPPEIKLYRLGGINAKKPRPLSYFFIKRACLSFCK